jgi:RND family efflux transporter MFP subunit
MNTNVDLRQLVVRRDGVATGAPVRQPRRLLSRYLLPGAVLLGFTALLSWAARDSLLPSRSVQVVPVLTSRASIQQEGTPLFQAAGWVEPRPTPILVTALAEGVIDKLLVVEGQEVKPGEPVARLIDADARLALLSAEADLRLRRAEGASALAALKAAQVNADRLISLRSALVEAESLLAQKETEVGNLPFQLKSAQSRLDTARTTFGNTQGIIGSRAVADQTFREERREMEMSKASVEELTARGPRLQSELKTLLERRAILRERLELKIEETRALAEGQAQVEAAEARLQQAQVAVDTARLRLDRMTVRAPVGGNVLALLARPGQRLMGQTVNGQPEASTIVSLYDPAQLQVRADVRLEDVPRVQPGQLVKIETPAVPAGPLDGATLFLTSQADIQKNTLQVKVAIKGRHATIRPDMLVQVTFLAPPRPMVPNLEAEPLRLLIPRSLVTPIEGGPRVWTADQAAGVARLKAIKLGMESGEWVEVVEGLQATDRLIAGDREGLRDGQRITVAGEEAPGSSLPAASRPTLKRLPNPVGDGGNHGNH